MINHSLLALACGDSYGSHYEMMGLYGNTFDISKLPCSPITVQITDDTKMATILLQHYLKHKTIKPRILKKSYKDWALREGDDDGIGIHTKEVLVNNKKNKDSQGNGALMRNIPFGCKLIDDGYSFDDALELMNKDSALTHENKTIFQANHLALDLAINGLKALENKAHQNIVVKLKYGHTAWIIFTLYIVIEALKKELSFIDAFKYIVASGGDTDTNCAIFGAIKGYRENIRDSISVERFLDKKIENFLHESPYQL